MVANIVSLLENNNNNNNKNVQWYLLRGIFHALLKK